MTVSLLSCLGHGTHLSPLWQSYSFMDVLNLACSSYGRSIHSTNTFSICHPFRTVALPALVRVIRCLELSDLTEIDALLGCAISLPSPAVYAKFSSQDTFVQKVALDCLFLTCNWFRETINSFVYLIKEGSPNKVRFYPENSYRQRMNRRRYPRRLYPPKVHFTLFFFLCFRSLWDFVLPSISRIWSLSVSPKLSVIICPRVMLTLPNPQEPVRRARSESWFHI